MAVQAKTKSIGVAAEFVLAPAAAFGFEPKWDAGLPVRKVSKE
jgi:hypothetical protein